MLRTILATLLARAAVACAGDDKAAREALAAVDAGALLIDVRSAEEFAGGHLPGALNIPHPQIVVGVQALGTAKEAPIVLYCRTGNRSGIAKDSLAGAGYTNVSNAGAYSALKPIWDQGR